MSCYKYWGKIEEIADKLSSYGDLDNEGLSALDGTDIDEITMILDEIEVIAHDKEIDFDSAKHILDVHRCKAGTRERHEDIGIR